MEILNEITKRLQLPSLAGSVSAYDPMAHARMKADSFNAMAGSMGGTDCPKCRNKGQTAHPREDGSIYTRECSCMTMRRCVLAMERSGLKNVIRELTFDKFLTEQPWQEMAKEAAVGYSQDPQGWFLACGQSGSGKTHLCTAICRELLLRGKQVIYMSWRQDVAELKALRLDSERRSDRLKELKEAQYLYIDDLFKGGAWAEGDMRPTAADVSIAFEIINHRYVNYLPTILSTELLPEELLRQDEATGGRIVEMARGHSVAIGRDSGKNHRLEGLLTL